MDTSRFVRTGRLCRVTSNPGHLVAYYPAWLLALESAVASGCWGSSSQAETQKPSLCPSAA